MHFGELRKDACGRIEREASERGEIRGSSEQEKAAVGEQGEDATPATVVTEAAGRDDCDAGSAAEAERSQSQSASL